MTIGVADPVAVEAARENTNGEWSRSRQIRPEIRAKNSLARQPGPTDADCSASWSRCRAPAAGV